MPVADGSSVSGLWWSSVLRLLLPIAAMVIAGLAVTALLDRMALSERASERRALLQRHTELAAAAMAPGSTLSCLDGGVGETVENACEKAVFGDPQAAARAVTYTAARLALLKDAAEFAGQDADLLASFDATRRALELDRYGLVAHVLAEREGCTVNRCSAFTLFRDTSAINANLRVNAFDHYIERYATAWLKSEPKEAPVAETPPPAAVASAPEQPDTVGHAPVSSKYDFPSAASIPPVSIMNAEPPMPKTAETPAAPGDTAAVPVPPKRPQAQAATPPAR